MMGIGIKLPFLVDLFLNGEISLGKSSVEKILCEKSNIMLQTVSGNLQTFKKDFESENGYVLEDGAKLRFAGPYQKLQSNVKKDGSINRDCIMALFYAGYELLICGKAVKRVVLSEFETELCTDHDSYFSDQFYFTPKFGQHFCYSFNELSLNVIVSPAVLMKALLKYKV